MIVGGFDALFVEYLCNLLGTHPASYIDNAATLGALQNMCHFTIFIVDMPYAICQILALKTHLENFFLPEKEFLLNVFHN